MRIGVISDTHDKLSNVRRIVDLMNRARVERVVHTGDITKAKTLDVLAGLDAPMCGVFGNNDLERDTLDAAIARHGFTFSEPPLELTLCERRIVVLHDPKDEERPDDAAPRVVLHGHTHRFTEERWPDSLRFNPGECAGMMRGRNAVGVVDVATLEIEILRF